jgi:biotin carboxyl carrier protein
MELELIVNGVRRTIALEKEGDRFVIREGTSEIEADIRKVSENELHVSAEGRSQTVWLAGDGRRRFLNIRGRGYTVTEPPPETSRFAGAEDKTGGGGSAIRAPMPGRVIKVNVVEGQHVRKNQSLAIVEAMKMENEIRSSTEGVVKRIFVSAGELVDSEKTLIELEPKA